MNKPIKAGVIGLGIGERHANIYEINPHSQLTTICDFEENKLKEISPKFPNAKKTTNDKEIIHDDQIELVSIASYDNYHASQVIECLKNKKHVFVEKPICLNEQELTSIIETLKQNSEMSLSSNFVLRSSHIFKELKNNIKSGNLGEIYYIEGDYNYGRLSKITEGWRSQIPSYSVTLGGGMHLIDLITWLLDKRVESVVSTGNKICSQHSGFKSFDLVSSLLKIENTIAGKITSNFGSVSKHHHCLRVYGTKGTFLYTNQGVSYKFDSELPLKNSDIIALEEQKYDKSEVLNSFINELVGISPCLITKRQVINNMLISLAIDRSLSSEKWENIDYSVCDAI